MHHDDYGARGGLHHAAARPQSIRRLRPHGRIDPKDRGQSGAVRLLHAHCRALDRLLPGNLNNPSACDIPIGKTAMAIKLAKHFSAEVFSADSRQIYQEMTIGTAVPTTDEMRQVPHRFIHHVPLTDHYHAGQYERDVMAALEEYFLHKRIAILCGGTGLYIQAILEGLDDIPEISESTRQLVHDWSEKGLPFLQGKLQELDPEILSEIDIDNPQRVVRALSIAVETGNSWKNYRNTKAKDRPFTAIPITLTCDRTVLYERINRRVDDMIKQGLVEEVKSLLTYKEHILMATVGYKEIISYLEGDLDKEKAIELIKRNSRRYAKRQMTWFRNQGNFKPFPYDDAEGIIRYVDTFIKT